MKRILFLVSSMHGGGAERVAAVLCNYWAEHGHKVTLMPTFSGRGECVYPLDSRVQLDFLADHVHSKRSSWLNKIKRYLALRRTYKEFKPDVVVSFLPPVNIAAVVAGLGLSIPIVVSERSYPPVRPIGRVMDLLRGFAYARAHAVVVQTQRTQEWLKDYCPGARGKVIPNPVLYPLPESDPVLEPGETVGADKKTILAVGRLVREKGFDLLLSAFEQLAPKFPDWQLVILGDGPLRQDLTDVCEEKNLVGRVHMPGRTGTPGAWYEESDLYVMSSRFEGFPNTLIEAMAYGLPAISFDCATGPSDIIREGVDGLLVPPTQKSKGLARAMETLMQDEGRRQSMGKKAVSVRQRFGRDTVMSEWNQVLNLRDGSPTI